MEGFYSLRRIPSQPLDVGVTQESRNTKQPENGDGSHRWRDPPEINDNDSVSTLCNCRDSETCRKDCHDTDTLVADRSFLGFEPHSREYTRMLQGECLVLGSIPGNPIIIHVLGGGHNQEGDRHLDTILEHNGYGHHQCGPGRISNTTGASPNDISTPWHHTHRPDDSKRAGRTQCSTCNGDGFGYTVHRMGPTTQKVEERCSDCHGTGRQIDPIDISDAEFDMIHSLDRCRRWINPYTNAYPVIFHYRREP
ncbi:hypothetical protein K439DRAFT_143110 [Ramaria rubella]|nr:hypothetical protein K439DRAFT_143110 [Ramaria rubella]